MADPLVRIARAAIAAGIGGRPYVPVTDFGAAQPLFVSLHDGTGALRGCVGHMDLVSDTLGGQVAKTALLAATADPRFPPVGSWEVDGLAIEVDLLGPTEPVTDLTTLDPKRYGVVVTDGPKRGVLLPHLDGVDTVDQQLAIVLSKAGIAPSDAFEIARFEVERHR